MFILIATYFWRFRGHFHHSEKEAGIFLCSFLKKKFKLHKLNQPVKKVALTN
jgi:hypothetical protein